MTRKAYLKKLIQLGRIGEALEELNAVAADTYYENTSILLLGQYNSLRQDAMGLISEEQKNLRKNRLLASTNSLMKDLIEEVPTLFEVEVEVDEAKLKAPAEPISSQSSADNSSTTFIIQGDVTNINSNIKGGVKQGDITQNIDKSTNIFGGGASNAMPLKELIEVEQQAGFITKEEYEELLDILEDIQENQGKPNDKQKRKWSRWLGKALEAGGKFTGERLEKGMDAGISHGLKEWLGKGGLDHLKSMIDTIVS